MKSVNFSFVIHCYAEYREDSTSHCVVVAVRESYDGLYTHFCRELVEIEETGNLF